MTDEEAFEKLSGLAFFERVRDGGMEAPMGALMGHRLEQVSDGVAVISVLPDARFKNYHGRMHGGFAATVLDSALGVAVATKMPPSTSYGTIDLKVTYVRKIDVAVGEMNAISKILHAGRTVLTAEAKLVDKAGKLYAHATGTFMVYPKQ